MRKVILLKWDALTVATISILYGTQLLIHPSVLENYRTFDVLKDTLNSYTYGLIFIVIGLLKVISILLNYPVLRAISISLIIFLWVFFTVSFYLSSSENFTWILSFGIVITSFGVVIKEWFH